MKKNEMKQVIVGTLLLVMTLSNPLSALASAGSFGQMETPWDSTSLDDALQNAKDTINSAVQSITSPSPSTSASPSAGASASPSASPSPSRSPLPTREEITASVNNLVDDVRGIVSENETTPSSDATSAAAAEQTTTTASAGAGSNTEDSGENISDNVVVISTAADFLNFAKNCKVDSYSYGMVFELENDIVVSDSFFEGVPYFNGEFHGNGHRIEFGTLRPSGSHEGFFRYIGTDGEVDNLIVSGNVIAEGSAKYIGGIVGVNKGTLNHCNFYGEVSGDDYVGGITGCNKENALINGCYNYGEVSATNYSGGIAGRNDGTISFCRNKGDVNIEELDSNVEISDVVDVSSFNITQNVVNRNNMGGIAGISNGVIRICYNEGTIGYLHTGYNVGGIAGSQSGTVVGSYNLGDVYGRKDVGGIVGQAEPYIESDYLKDTVSDTQEDLNQLNDTLSGINSSLSSTSEDVRRYADSLNEQYNETMTTVSDNLLDIIDTVSENYPEAQPYVDKINEAMDNINELQEKRQEIEDIDWDNLTQEDIDKLPDGVKNTINQYLDQYAKSHAAQLAAALGKNVSEVTKSDISLKDLPSSVKNEIKQLALAEVISETQDNLKVVYENLDYIQDIYKEYADSPEDMLTQASDEIKNMDNGSKDVQSMIDTVDSGTQEILSGVDSALDQANAIVNNVSDDLNMVLSEDDQGYIEDVSSVDTIKDMNGVITYCVNDGKINGDLNVGGIAGTMNIEYDDDPEYDLDLTGEVNITIRTTVNCVIANCRNDSTVEVKKNYAGGTVGLQELGLVYNCQAYGPVTSTDGDRIGGIAGYSAATIRSCYSLCTVSGAEYIGGIVGDGYTILDSIAICQIQSEDECLGEIAGYVEEEGTVKNNYFCSDDMEGIDGISYSGMAEHRTYDEIMAMEGIPYSFQIVTVTFETDEEELSQLRIHYGSKLTEEDYPEVPAKEGYYVEWPTENIAQGIYANVVLTAQYIPWINSVAGDKAYEIDDTYSANIFLALGEFYEGTKVEMTETSGPQALEDDTLVYAYDWKLNSPQSISTDTVVGHFYGTEDCEHAQLYVMLDGNWTKVDTTVDGTYLVAEIPVGAAFAVMIHPTDYTPLILSCSGGAVLVLLVLLIVTHKKNKKKKQKE